MPKPKRKQEEWGIKLKTFQEWAEDYEKYLHYAQEFVKRNEDYQRDCKSLSEEEVFDKWGVTTYETGAIFRGIPGVDVVQSKGKILNLSIDLETPISLLVHSFIYLVRVMKKAKKIPEKNIPWGMLDIYLQILDLIGEGKNTEEIASEIYPHEYKRADDTESLIRRVRKNIKRSKEITKTGTFW